MIMPSINIMKMSLKMTIIEKVLVIVSSSIIKMALEKMMKYLK